MSIFTKIKDKVIGIKDFVMNFLAKYNSSLQKVGAIALLVALVLLFIKQILFCYIGLGFVLLIDLYLVAAKQQTITQWWRPKLPKLVDTIITIGLAGVFIWFNPVAGAYFLFGTINGHLNGDW